MLNPRILVTGGHGFLGQYLLKGLQAAGFKQVIAPTSREYDLREKSQIVQLLQDTRPEYIFHLAAMVGGIGANRAYPAEFFYDNLLMGVQLFHEAWQAGVEKFITVGTVCEYPKFTPVPFQESALWDGYPEETNAPYGMAKKMLLVQGSAYREQYGFNSIHLLLTNLYGPGDDASLDNSHVIPALIRKCLEAKAHDQEAVTVWGTGKATRDFLFVEDAVQGIIKAAFAYDEPMPLNLGSGRETSIRELVHQIMEATGYKGQVVWDTTKPDGQPRRVLDTTHAQELLGFVAPTPLEVGIPKTVAWYERIDFSM